MIDPPNVTQPSVIHVAPIDTSGRTREVEEWLTATQAPTRSYGDVYRALPSILRGRLVRVVVVCVDGLDAPEMEFFSILARLRHDVRVLVYASDPASPRISEALHRGAATLASRDVLHTLLGSPARKPDEELPSAAPVIGTPVPRAIFEKPPDEPLLEEPTDDEEVEQPARVPWRRYEHRPARAAPSPTSPPAPHEGVSEQPPIETGYEPLLTQAEIDALMSDDVSSIAPNEPHRWKDGPAARRES